MKAKQTHIVAGIGEVLWDLLPEGKQLGGAPCNFAYHALQTGLKSHVISAIGDDDEGKEIQEVMEGLGLNTSLLQTTSAHPTGSVSVELDESGSPEYTIHENVAWDFIEQNSNLNAFANKVDAICFGSLAQRNQVSMSTISAFLSNTKPDCLKVFDINLRQSYYSREIILKSLELANVLKLNDAEINILAAISGIVGDEESILRQLLNKFQLNLIAYTKGDKGSILLTPQEISSIGAQKVKVKDTVGAGDSFTAILTAGILNNLELKKIHRMATNVASYVCTQHGATPKLPTELIETI